MAQSFFIVDLPNGKMVIFHSYDNVYQRVIYQLDQGLSRILVWQHFRSGSGPVRANFGHFESQIISNHPFSGENNFEPSPFGSILCFGCIIFLALIEPIPLLLKYTMMWFGSRYWSDQHLTNPQWCLMGQLLY